MRRQLSTTLYALSLLALARGASAEITIPRASRVGATPIAAPAFRGACGYYGDFRVNADAMGRDNHTLEGLAFLQTLLDMPSDARVLGTARASMPRLDLTHHRSGGCYSPGETPGGTVWPIDPATLATAPLGAAGRYTGFLNIPGTAGTPVRWSFALAANDATQVRIGGVLTLQENFNDAQRWKKFSWVTFEEPGVYPIEIRFSTNHVCNIDPLELYYAPRQVPLRDNACGCGLLCLYDPLGCTETTDTIPAEYQLVGGDLLMAQADGSAPPASAMCGAPALVVDPGSPGTFVGCVSDRDCSGSSLMCDPMSRTCVSSHGNARVDRGEQCDDGNVTAGDGCSAAGTIESGFACVAGTTVANGSFEAPVVADLSGFNASTPTGWTLSGAPTVNIHREGADSQGLAPDGTQFVDLNGTAAAAIHQDISTVVGILYTVGLRFAANENCTVGTRTATLRALTPAAAVLATATLSTGLSSLRGFSSTVLRFTATTTTTRLSLTGTSAGSCGVFVDAVSPGSVCTLLDSDGDGIPDLDEVRIGTNPTLADSDGDGVPDGREVGAGPTFTTRDTDGDGMHDALDNDDDGDGVPTAMELGAGGFMTPRNTDATVPSGSGTSDTVPDYLDNDDDGDGIPTRTENTLEAMGGAPDADGVPAYLDLDSDGDTVPDSVEAGATPSTPANTDSADRPDFLDLDSDNDCATDSAASEAGAARITPAAMPNMNCAAPTPVCNTTIGVCAMDTDLDMDGIPNLDEVRIGTDPMNPDSDGDGDPDGTEVGPGPTFAPVDTDADGSIDARDTDSDNDCAPDSATSEDGVARVTVSTMPDANCSGATPACDLTRGACVACIVRSGTTVGCATNPAGNACVGAAPTVRCGCNSSADCPAGALCDTATNTCGAAPDAGSEAGDASADAELSDADLSDAATDGDSPDVTSMDATADVAINDARSDVASTDATSLDGALDGATSPNVISGGGSCGCSTVGNTSNGSSPWALALAAAAVVVASRRRRAALRA